MPITRSRAPLSRRLHGVPHAAGFTGNSPAPRRRGGIYSSDTGQQVLAALCAAARAIAQVREDPSRHPRQGDDGGDAGAGRPALHPPRRYTPGQGHRRLFDTLDCINLPGSELWRPAASSPARRSLPRDGPRRLLPPRSPPPRLSLSRHCSGCRHRRRQQVQRLY